MQDHAMTSPVDGAKLQGGVEARVSFSDDGGRDAPLLWNGAESYKFSPSGRQRSVTERAARWCCMRGKSTPIPRSKRVFALVKTVANMYGDCEPPLPPGPSTTTQLRANQLAVYTLLFPSRLPRHNPPSTLDRGDTHC
jgi:hypothetical protein